MRAAERIIHHGVGRPTVASVHALAMDAAERHLAAQRTSREFARLAFLAEWEAIQMAVRANASIATILILCKSAVALARAARTEGDRP